MALHWTVLSNRGIIASPNSSAGTAANTIGKARDRSQISYQIAAATITFCRNWLS